jgi:hypothetical protein
VRAATRGDPGPPLKNAQPHQTTLQLSVHVWRVLVAAHLTDLVPLAVTDSVGLFQMSSGDSASVCRPGDPVQPDQSALLNVNAATAGGAASPRAQPCPIDGSMLALQPTAETAQHPHKVGFHPTHSTIGKTNTPAPSMTTPASRLTALAVAKDVLKSTIRHATGLADELTEHEQRIRQGTAAQEDRLDTQQRLRDTLCTNLVQYQKEARQVRDRACRVDPCWPVYFQNSVHYLRLPRDQDASRRVVNDIPMPVQALKGEDVVKVQALVDEWSKSEEGSMSRSSWARSTLANIRATCTTLTPPRIHCLTLSSVCLDAGVLLLNSVITPMPVDRHSLRTRCFDSLALPHSCPS